jgi:hypothetical protein
LDEVAITCPQDSDGCLQGSPVTVTLTRSVDFDFWRDRRSDPVIQYRGDVGPMKHTTRFPAQSIVEFALVIPVVLLLILGFFDLGRALINYSALTNAVREGARSGIVMAYDEAAIKNKVLEYAFTLTNTSAPLTADQIVPSITTTDGFAESLQITATYCFVPVTPGDRSPGRVRLCRRRHRD